MDAVQSRLFDCQDPAYRQFSCPLLPGVAPETVIGVRIPVIRAIAKEIKNTQEAAAFLRKLPHVYYEENHVHAALICQMQDFDRCLAALYQFLPYVDNWGVCDSLRPVCFKQHLDRLLPLIGQWLDSPEPYIIRFGIEMLMVHYLEDAFRPEYVDWVAGVSNHEHYYVRMMVAWYFATALAKQWDSVIPYLEERRLAPWVHHKTIQKAVESYRISPERKLYLKTLKG